MRARMISFACLILLLSASAFSENLPSRPKSADHPGSDVYSNGVRVEAFNFNSRSVSVYLPETDFLQHGTIPVVVFGAGQASPEVAYRETFMQLAGKGVAVIFPEYARGFFDTNWLRMGADYADLAEEAIKRFPELSRDAVVFSGHSKGGYVAGVAAGLENGLRPAALVLVQPAGFNAEKWVEIPANVPVTIIYSDADTIIEEDLVREMFEASQVTNKQYLYVKSYSSLSADHFFCFSKKTWVGGQDGISPFHYYGIFGWLIGAAKDLSSETPLTNPYIYGTEVTNSGDPNVRHEIERSW